jgi:hypothetical protein
MDRIDEAGYAAWDAFYTHMESRGRRRPKKQYWQDKFYKAFREIGQLCLENSFAVSDFIKVNFETIEKSQRYVTPRDFANGHAVARYAQHRQHLGNEARAFWTCQVTMLTDMECRMIPERYPNEEELLMNWQMPFTPWFRVLYPTPFNERLCKRFGGAAWAELHEDSQLCAFVRKQASNNLQALEHRYGKLPDRIVEEIQ